MPHFNRKRKKQLINGPFPSSLPSLFQSQSKCEIVVMIISFNFNMISNKDFALRLALKEGLGGTRKWSIGVTE